MAHINANKSKAAKINPQTQGLVEVRTEGKSIKIQDKLVELATVNNRLTMNQLSWLAAGGQLDSNGFCIPTDKYNMAQTFYSAKRRGSEITYKEADLHKHKRARLVYCEAANNPYTKSGGYGVRPITGKQTSPLSDQVAPSKVTYELPAQAAQPKPAPVAQKPANKPVQQPKPNAAQHVASIQDMLK